MNKNNMNAVPLNTTTLNTRLLNTTRLNTNGFPMLSKRGGSSADISQAITDSLVCWYDIGKQQCTNESMAANPVLTDLSGNGHDITCYNFAWSGMSGIGGYAAEVFLGGDFILSTGKATIINKSKVHITHTPIGNAPTYSIYEYRVPVNTIIQPTKIKVSGLNNNFIIKGRTNNLFSDVLIDKDGIYELPSINNTFNNDIYPGLIVEPADIDCDITIELLPEYPNALVSDGVDDYAQVTGLPLLTKERGYTVIAKRKLLNFPFTKSQTLAMKGDRTTTNTQAFSFERYINSASPSVSVSFGTVSSASINNDDLISYQTSVSYNGEKINKGNYIDEDILTIFGHKNSGSILDYCSAAIYSFLLFDRDLTTAEIEWVKKNMVESGGGVENGLE